MPDNKNTPEILQQMLKFKLVKRVRVSLFIQRVSLTLTTRLVLLVMVLFLSIITARYLGPEGRGIYAVTASIVAMGVQFGNLGLHSANTYFITSDKSLLGKLIGNTLWVSIE
jgi:O-antigen/teichoic acid export membrane protein